MQINVLVPGRGRPYIDGDNLDLMSPLVFSIPDVLAPSECGRLIERIEAAGPTAAPVTTARGPVMRPDLRNNQRVILDDVDLAASLFERVKSVLPAELCGMAIHGANERFRCYRYDPQQRFAPHYDGAFIRDEHERSHLTFMIYLNDGFAGGHTAFHEFDVSVAPKQGAALLFQHALLHEGCVVTAGTKYVLRSDILYRARC